MAKNRAKFRPSRYHASTSPHEQTPEDPDAESPDLGATPVLFHFKFSGANALTPGPRALRAYVYDSAVDPGASPPFATALQKSAVTTVLLKHGAELLG